MRTTSRLDAAITKLYNAFHNNELNPECCKQCAVGNILNKTDSWKHLSDEHGVIELNYIGKIHQSFGRKFNGYSPLELLNIEATFLSACGYKLPIHHKNNKPENPTDKSVLFDGLCAVIELLCKFDGVSNVMDYTKLFKFEKEIPKYEFV